MRKHNIQAQLPLSRVLLLLMVAITLTACGIQFQSNALYDGVEKPIITPTPERISMVVEPVIFKESAANFWTPNDNDCTTGGPVSDVTHSGEQALKISWNRGPKECIWAGFGIGWDNWAGKDLSEIFEEAAIQMYVRSEQGKMFGLPVVLTLEDYSGNMAWSYTGNKYFERYFIDEEWQKVVVPLNTFDLSEDGLDISNVKQLMFELQQAGSIYLDDIQLVFYEPPPTEIWLPEEPTAGPAVSYPVQLFDENFINNNGWGIFKDHCQDIRLTKETSSSGASAIHANWDTSKDECYRVGIGVSWTNWFRTDLAAARDDLVIQMSVKSDQDLLEAQNMRIGFESYQRGLGLVTLNSTFLKGGAFVPGQWQDVTIPVSALPDNIDYSDIKQFVIYLDQKGEAYFDNIRLVRMDI